MYHIIYIYFIYSVNNNSINFILIRSYTCMNNPSTDNHISFAHSFDL